MTCFLFSWGANSHGQLGQGIQSEECKTPQKVDLSKCSLNPKDIKKIAGGAGHTLILDTQGNVYACGWNNKGQAGFLDENGTFVFQQVGGDIKNKIVVDIECGWDSSAALTRDGLLYVWGSNYYGQLGRDPNELQWTDQPFPVLPDCNITRVSMGLRHTAIIREDDIVLVAGSGTKGQLGLNPLENNNLRNNTYTFTEVPGIRNAVDVACGQHHTIVATKDGDIYAFGDNKHGQLGVNPKTSLKSTVPIKISKLCLNSAAKLHAGWSHTSILNGIDKEVISWGRNTYGQLGCKEEERPVPWEMRPVKNLAQIRQISVGSEHTIALSEDKTVYCWGWNEHGNCGVGHTRDVLIPQTISFCTNYTATLVGTGAGHSLAVVNAL